MARHPKLVNVPLPPHPLQAERDPLPGDYMIAAGRWFIFSEIRVTDGVPCFAGLDVLTDKPVSHSMVSDIRIAMGR